MLDHSLLISMTNWADSLRGLYWSNRYNNQLASAKYIDTWIKFIIIITMIFTLQLLFVIFLFAQTHQHRKAWGYICYTLIVVQSKPAADWNVDKQFTSDTNFAKVSEKKKDYLGWSISGVTKRVHRTPPPTPYPQKTSFISQTSNFFYYHFSLR